MTDTKTSTRTRAALYVESAPASPYAGYKVRYQVDGNEYEHDLSEYPRAYIDHLCENECGSLQEVADVLSEWMDSPLMVPVQVINLNAHGAMYFFRRPEGMTISDGYPYIRHLGPIDNPYVMIEQHNHHWWVCTEGGHNEGMKMFNWCYINCKGDWLISLGERHVSGMPWPLMVSFLHDADAEAFDKGFSSDV